MTVDLKSKSALVVDGGGLFVSLAERLVGHFGKVGYFLNWQCSFPDGRETMVGTGLDNITREKYLWPVINDYDLFVFPDVWDGDMQEYLRSIGKRVWGSGMGSDLELSRWTTRQKFPELGLPSPKSVQVIGTVNLRAYLKQNPKQYIKISTFRGMGETWYAEDYDMAKGEIDELDDHLGPVATILGFTVEAAIPDAIESGYDGYCIDGEFPSKAVVGIEKKDKAYAGRACDYDDLPKEVRDTNTKISYAMRNGYRQFFSTEIRDEFLIDITARHASPAGEVITQMFTNLPEILWWGAEGKLLDPVIEEPFGAQMIICADWAMNHYAPVRFPEDIRPFVKLYNHCRVDGVDYFVPQLAKMEQIGSVIALGESLESAVELCKQRAKQVIGYEVVADEDALDNAAADLEKI